MRFEPGAPQAAGTIPLCVPEVRGNEWKYLKECLDTNFVSSVGPFVDRFERMLADYVGVKYAVATVNGTAALHIALQLAGVRPGDEVLLPSLTFIAPANAIRYAGAWPVFVDVEPDYWQMDPEKVRAFLEKSCEWSEGQLRNRTSGRRVRAIVPVHVLGHPVAMDPVMELAAKYELKVIEDATESLGASYHGKKTGRLGHAACFSFNGNKIITTGGGGMIVTDDEAWARRAKYLTTQAKDDPLEYIHNEIGYNYRLTNLQGAMGCAQMESLDDYVATKRRIASTYTAKFGAAGGLTPQGEAGWAYASYWMYTVRVESAGGAGSRDLLRHLLGQRIQARPLWQPMHLSPAHAEAVAMPCPVAESLYRDGISLPCSVGLTMEDQIRVIESVLRWRPA